MRRENRKTAIIAFVITAAAVAVFAIGPSLLARQSGSIDGEAVTASASPVFSVRTVPAERRDLQTYIEVNGNIVNENQIDVLPIVGGALVSMKVSLGSAVRRGDLVAEVDPSRPGTTYSLSSVTAPVTGVVTGNSLPVGSTVSSSTVLFSIAASSKLEIETWIPEREVGQLGIGLTADIRLEAFPGEVFTAKVTKTSPFLDPVSRTKKAVLAFNQEDPRINAGMFARVKLNTRLYPNVITVPAEALVVERGVNGVYVVFQNPQGETEVSFREVTTGASVDGETEIRSGIEAGVTVVVQGQQFLTDGAKVRVIGRSIE
jgi:multidrug efflux pump subunit AcrA (membrane-fusion protein)